MAIYSCNISNVSRAKGSSSCATLSYISAKSIYEERTGNRYSYGRNERVATVNTILPDNAPEEYKNPEILFNAIENYETAQNARTAKKIMVALPREFTLELQKEVVESFIQQNLTSQGYAATYAIHHDKENHNPHAHILVVNRQIGEKGEWSCKRKMEYALDENGERIPRLDENGLQKVDKRGRKQWVRINAEQNPLDKKEFLQNLREQWAISCNLYLDQENKIDHRSYEEQGVPFIPTIHDGYAARQMVARGEASDRVDQNLEIAERNTLLRMVIHLMKEIIKEIPLLKQLNEYQESYEKALCTQDNSINGKFFAQLAKSEVDRLTAQSDNKQKENDEKFDYLERLLPLPEDKIQEIKPVKETPLKQPEQPLKPSESVTNIGMRDIQEKRQIEPVFTPSDSHTVKKDRDEKEKSSRSLTERFKEWRNDRAKEKAEKKALEQEQARKRAEERAKTEAKKRETFVKMQRSFPRNDYEGRLQQLHFIERVYLENIRDGGDKELRETAFKKLGEIAGVETREYNMKRGCYVDKDSRTVPFSEIDDAVKKTEKSIHKEKVKEEQYWEMRKTLQAMQEEKEEQLSENQKDRQTQLEPISHDLEL
jgi:hypothetical protein